MIGQIHTVIVFSCLLCLAGALRRLMHTKVCFGLAHLPSLMYGFIMQQADNMEAEKGGSRFSQCLSVTILPTN